MSILTAAGNFGCYAAAHFINSLDELSYLIENSIIDKSNYVEYLSHLYTPRSSGNQFAPNVIYLERAAHVCAPSKYQKWRASQGEKPARFDLNVEINSVRDMLDDQSFINIPKLAKNRPSTEHEEITFETLRHLLEGIDRVTSVMVPLDSAKLANHYLDIIPPEQLIPNPIDFFEDELDKTPIFILSGTGLDARTLPSSELHAQQMILQSALSTYLDIHQRARDKSNFLLCPIFQCPLIPYPAMGASASESCPTTEVSLNLDTVYDKAFIASTIIHAASASKPSIWGALRTPYSPLISANVKMSLCTWHDNFAPPFTPIWSYQADLTRLDPSFDAEALSRYHQFHTSSGARLDRIALSASTDLKKIDDSAILYNYTLSSAVNGAELRPPASTTGAITAFLRAFLPQILHRTDIVDRVDRDHIVDLANVLNDILDDCRIASEVC